MHLSNAVLAVLFLVLGASGGGGQVPGAGGATAESRRVFRLEGLAAERPYADGVLAGDTLYLSAQAGRDPLAGRQPDGIAAQTRQAMGNLAAVLKSAGMGYANLVKCHVYLASMDDYTGMNEAYGSVFRGRVPARTTVQAHGLPAGSGVQIGCVAFRDLARITVVQPPKGALPAPLGPYSAAVWAGETLYLSGMGGQFPEDRRLPDGLGQQVAQTLVNIGRTLTAAGLGLADAVSSSIYVTARDEAEALAPAYALPFGAHQSPPQGVVFLPRLPGGIKTEITLVAARRAGPRRVIGEARPGSTPARGLLAGRTLYTNTESAPDAGSDAEQQFRAVVRRLGDTLEEAGLHWRHVAHMQVYLADLSDVPAVDRLFRETFPAGSPARTIIEVLPGGAARVQASLVAVR